MVEMNPLGQLVTLDWTNMSDAVTRLECINQRLKQSRLLRIREKFGLLCLSDGRQYGYNHLQGIYQSSQLPHKRWNKAVRQSY